jgi:ribosomal protein S18 acetylase RimI-like enzyme
MRMNDADASISHAQSSGSPSFSEVLVRVAGAGDAAVLHDVAAATFALACPPGTTQQGIDDFIATTLSEARFDEYLADGSRVLVLAEIDGVAVGYTMVIVGEPTDADVLASITTRPTAELSKLYVLAGHHGAGIAPKLVDASVAVAVERGARAMWLGVNQLNARANRFYEKSGFSLVGTKRFLVGGKYEDDFVRERLLDESTQQ